MALTKIKLNTMVTGTLPDANIPDDITIDTAAAVPASGLTGNTLASGVTASSLTSVGTLTSLNTTGAVSLGTQSSGLNAFSVNRARFQSHENNVADMSVNLGFNGSAWVNDNDSQDSQLLRLYSGQGLTYYVSSAQATPNLVSKFSVDTSGNATFAGNITQSKAGNLRLTQTATGTGEASLHLHANNSTGDSFIRFQTDSNTFAMGFDNSDGDKFIISAGSDPHSNSVINIQPDGSSIAIDKITSAGQGLVFTGTALGTGHTGIGASGGGGDLRIYTNGIQTTTFASGGNVGIKATPGNDTTLTIENSDTSDHSYIIDGKHTATNANGFGARFSTVATGSGRDILTLRSGTSGNEVSRFNFRADGSSVQTSTNQASVQHATSYHYHQSDMNGLSADNTFAYAYMYNVSGSGSGGTTARIKYSNEGNQDYDAQWIFTTYKQAIWAETNALVLNHNNATFSGALSKGSGSFKIDHPLPSMKDTHYLVHSFTESPRADLIYRDKVTLVKGKAVVNIDTIAGMTEGTFVLLCDDVQCFTSNESDWSAVKGSVKGNILTIECEDSDSTADVAWMVVADRKDEHIMETKWTDENGKPIIEPKKETKKEEEKVEEDKDHPTGEDAIYKEKK